ncbi:SPFH domain-containing protein [Candidatus Sumerlaeota bacterium]|nr:SPFH domain-containing protein [Candidatus Sumerlaeota bacterium]
MSQERVIETKSGWGMLVWDFFFVLLSIGSLIYGIMTENLWFLAVMIPGIVLVILISAGFMVIPPNQAGVLLLFGKYIGSVKSGGFKWVNPFYSKRKISLRLRNLNGDKLKVNDKAGNPIEIAAVVVWNVRDTFEACFEVDDYIDYVEVQSEAALRHLATKYPYDSWDDEDIISLRANIDEVSEALEQELLERLGRAGVHVHEARLSHLAYAPEIAEAMLKRQQAGAIVAARTKIVEGAVGMVEMALNQLKRDQIVDLDDERRATMVSNLLVVLCGETNAQPVVNAGSLYT